MAPLPMGLHGSCNPVCVLSFWEEEGIDLVLLQPPCLAVGEVGRKVGSLALNNVMIVPLLNWQG